MCVCVFCEYLVKSYPCIGFHHFGIGTKFHPEHLEWFGRLLKLCAYNNTVEIILHETRHLPCRKWTRLHRECTHISSSWRKWGRLLRIYADNWVILNISIVVLIADLYISLGKTSDWTFPYISILAHIAINFKDNWLKISITHILVE